MTELVVASLEAWDGVWRRNQHVISRMLHDDPELRVLFVEPAADPLHRAVHGGGWRPSRGLRPVDEVAGPGRLWTLQATKWLPRSIDRRVDERLAAAAQRAARRLGFRDPVLWVNDPSAVALMERSGWPALYDMTDDWVEASRPERERQRLIAAEAVLFERAREVVACSPELQRRKAPQRPATAAPIRLVQNAVDLSAYAGELRRPADLPPGPLALYVGTLHVDRIDLELCEATARALAEAGGRLVFVGPAPLAADERARLDAAGAVLLGPRPHHTVPAYLTHAELLVVPHLVDDFTSSLDPIKAYEYRAAGRPVLSTHVPGFADSGDPRVHLAEAAEFPEAAARLLRAPLAPLAPPGAAAAPAIPDWNERAAELAAVVASVRRDGDGDASSSLTVLQAAPRIAPGAGVAGVAAALESGLAALGVRTERFTIDDAHGGWIPQPSSGVAKRLALVAEVVWFSVVGGALLRRRASGDTVVITHNDALAGDVYVNHGVLKASLHARGNAALRLLRNPLHLFVTARDGWRYRSGLHRYVVALTPGESRVLRETYPRLRPPIEVIPNGVDTTRFAPATEEQAGERRALRQAWRLGANGRAVLFVGHEYDRKGLPLIIEALPRVPTGTKLVVVGGTPEMIRGAERTAARLGVADRVVFEGTVREPAPYFRAADVFCLPSSYEANALVVLEALAAGVPVVATRVGFAAELVDDGVSGLLIERSVDDVAAALSRLSEVPLAPWRRAARQTAERYAWSEVAEQYAALARRVLAER